MSLVDAVKEMRRNIKCTPLVKRLFHFTLAIFEKTDSSHKPKLNVN